jgi:hypothetical protein
MNLEALRINTTNPCLILFLLDQSGSMSETFGGDDSTPKDEALANAVNETIHNIGLKCISGQGEIRNRFEISVIGYGKDGKVNSAFEGNLKGKWVVKISDIFNNPYKYDDESDGAPIWISPVSSYATPMAEAFRNAYDLCNDWINYENHVDCHPPIIINISDGQPTDGGRDFTKLKTIVNQIKSLKTNYGNTYVFNVHISSLLHDKVLFPNSIESIESTYAKLLFNLSSKLNSKMLDIGVSRGYNIDSNSRGFIFNGNSSDLINFLNIGSSPS